ncbi:MAG: hypothetical protein OEY14_08155 [Myxococcales bacterium]|nr:hypothetical protein [Myxococcales bacterium]
MSAIAQLRGVEGVRLRETPLCREVKPLRQTCGACPASLAQLTLSWDERWAEVEECGACGLFYLDPGELEGVAEMMIEAAGVIADSDLERSE